MKNLVFLLILVPQLVFAQLSNLYNKDSSQVMMYAGKKIIDDETDLTKDWFETVVGKNLVDLTNAILQRGISPDDVGGLQIAYEKAADDTAVVVISTRQSITTSAPDTVPVTAILAPRGGIVNVGRKWRIEGKVIDPGPVQWIDGNIDSVEFAVGSVDYVRPEWFGAIGDSTTNSTIGIQAAINTANTKTTIYFSPGVYLIDSLVIKKPLNIKGASQVPDYLAKLYDDNPDLYPQRDNATVLKLAPAGASGRTMLKVNRSIDDVVVSIENIVFDGNDGDVTDVSSNKTIAKTQDVTLTYAGDSVNGIVVEPASGSENALLYLRHVFFTGLSGTALDPGRYATLSDLRFQKCDTAMVISENDVTASNIVIQNGNYGIYISGNWFALTNFRIEWMYNGFGIETNGNGNHRFVSGLIDRCYKAGIKINGSFAVNVSGLNLNRNAVYNRGETVAGVTGDEENSANIVVTGGARYIRIDAVNIRNNSRDDATGLNSPTLGTWISGGANFFIHQVNQNYDLSEVNSAEFKRSGGNNLIYQSDIQTIHTTSTGARKFETVSDTEYHILGGGGTVGIGTNSPNTSAILDLTSTTKVFLPPRMTDAEKSALSSVPTGAVLFNTGMNAVQIYDGASWWIAGDGNQIAFDATALIDTVYLPNSGVNANSVFLVSAKTNAPNTSNILSWTVTTDTLFVYRQANTDGVLNYSYIRIR